MLNNEGAANTKSMNGLGCHALSWFKSLTIAQAKMTPQKIVGKFCGFGQGNKLLSMHGYFVKRSDSYAECADNAKCC